MGNVRRHCRSTSWIRVAVVLGITTGFGTACANRAPAGVSPSESAAPVISNQPAADLPRYEAVTISLERTPCYGTCPVYSVTINQDGLVEYNGKMFVKVEGRQTREVGSSAVRELVALFYEVDFFAMQNRYDQMTGPGGVKMTVSDLPTTITTIAIDKHQKRVENYVGGPQELRRLEAMIDRVAGTEEWTRKSNQNQERGLRDPKP